jgi:hypothetical protein
VNERREPIDADLLVAYAEGRLDDERRAALEERLADDDEGRRMVALLVREGAGSAAAATSPAATGAPLQRSLLTWAAAAVLLVGAGAAGVWLLAGRPKQDSTAWLAATARTLAAESPDPFAGFVPLSADELAGGAEAPLRGGLVVTRPRGLLSGDRPEVTWTPQDGVESYEVTLTQDDGTVLWTRRAPAPPLVYPADAPALPRGRNVVVAVAGTGPLGRVESGVTVRAAPEPEEAAFRNQVARARGSADDDREDLLVAHLALRGGRLLEAETAARAYVARAPDDPLGKATLAHVERRLGLAR